MTFEEYLKKHHDLKIIDHALRAAVDEKGQVTFYIHPADRDGDTLDFLVQGNTLWANPNVRY
jgi:hypothetical protein